MAADGDGHPAEPGRKGKGKGKGINGYANGHATSPKSKSKTPKLKNKGRFNIFNIISRLFTWYIIITVLFRCPATPDLLTDTDPKLCKPYFGLKSIVGPHLEPYYQTYAAPYVDAGRPYYETVDQRIITPAISLGKQYGTPLAAQAQTYGQAQWEKNLQPQVLKYQGIAKEKYDQTLGPHIDSVIAAGIPYYEIARTNAFQTYYGHILPTYKTIRPYAIQTYDISSHVAVNTVIPYSKWAWTTSVVFLDRTVLPKVRILYGENVEPQLVRIGQRLGRYRDGKKLKAVVEEVDSSSSVASSSQTSSTAASSPESAYSTAGPTTTETAAAPPPEVSAQPLRPSEAEIREKAQNIVAHDLKTWQEKFAKAADEGSDELEERVTEISDKLIGKQANVVGNALVVELEDAVKSGLEALKDSIISIVKDSKAPEESEEALGVAVRKAGMAIKQKAQAVRTWRQSFDQETSGLISKAALDTFEILDHIRDLGLQEIGMRWAWTDGITHKDWAKYHKLKGKFEEWRVDVEAVVLEHPGLLKARAASEDIENTAMAIAEETAKELARLKETGRWKISANDASDDFTTKHMPPPAAPAEQQEQRADDIKDAGETIAPSSQGTVESVVSAASSSVTNTISAASSAATSLVDNIENIASASSPSSSADVDQTSDSATESQQGIVESMTSAAKASVSSIVDQASSSVIGTPQDTVESAIPVNVESVTEKSSETSSSINSEKSSVVEKATDSIKSAAFAVSNSASSLTHAASSSVSASSSAVSSAATEASSSLSSATSSIASPASDYSLKEDGFTRSVNSEAASASSTASKKVFGGAMAQSVKAREIIYEDEIDDSSAEEPSASSITPAPIAESIASQATQVYSDALSRASERYSQARSIVSAHISGEPKPIHEEMFSSINAAYSDSVAAATSRLNAAASAASTAVYGAPPGALESLSSVAQSRLSEGLNAASSRFQEGKDYLAATTTDTPQKQQLLLQLQEQYYAGVGMAHARYTEFVEAASSAILPTPTPTHGLENALKAAETLYSSALVGASSQLDQALSAIPKIGGSARETVPTSGLAAAASQRYSSVVAEASSSYSRVSSAIASNIQAGASKASTAVVGSETPITESIVSRASENWESLITKASSQIYGAPTPGFLTRRLVSEAKEYGAQVTDAAVSQYSAIQSLVSELVSGKEPDFTESVYNKLSSVYYTGAPAAASTASSVANEAVSSAQSKISSAIHGTQQGAMDSAHSQLLAAVESAKAQLAKLGASAGKDANQYIKQASKGVEEFASSASSVIGAATTSVKDEL